MIKVNFNDRCKKWDSCARREKVLEDLKKGDFNSKDIKELFKNELGGCCGSCEEKKY